MLGAPLSKPVKVLPSIVMFNTAPELSLVVPMMPSLSSFEKVLLPWISAVVCAVPRTSICRPSSPNIRDAVLAVRELTTRHRQPKGAAQVLHPHAELDGSVDDRIGHACRAVEVVRPTPSKEIPLSPLSSPAFRTGCAGGQVGDVMPSMPSVGPGDVQSVSVASSTVSRSRPLPPTLTGRRSSAAPTEVAVSSRIMLAASTATLFTLRSALTDVI